MMIENILPILKKIAFNFDYFLLPIIIIFGIFVNSYKNSYLLKKTIALAKKISYLFNKLANTKTLKLLLFFFLINFIIRLIMALIVPEMSYAVGDIISPHYVNLARSMFHDQGFTTHVIWNNFLEHPEIIRPDFFRVPFYPALITLFFFIFGESHLTAQLVNVLAGALLPLAGYLLSYTLIKSKKVSLLLMILLSVNILFLSWVAVTAPEIVYTLTAILTLYFLYKTLSQKYYYTLLTGAFWAFCYLTRTEALYIFLPVIIIFYFITFKKNKKKLWLYLLLTILSFLIVCSPYLARNYALKGSIFYSEFDKIAMVSFTDHGYLVESPEPDYQDMFELVQKKPIYATQKVVQRIGGALVTWPHVLMQSYFMGLLAVLGIFYAYKKQRHKMLPIWIAMVLIFLLPTISILFTDRYFAPLIILLFFFTCLAIGKLFIGPLKNKKIIKSIIIIYLAFFILLSGVVGIIKGTVALIPHSFYQRFDADAHFSNLEKFYDYIENNTQTKDVIMVSRRPYEAHYFTNRPVIIFPFASLDVFQKFIKKYQVKYIMHAGAPQKVNGKYFGFFLKQEIPENLELIFRNEAANLYKINYYK